MGIWDRIWDTTFLGGTHWDICTTTTFFRQAYIQISWLKRTEMWFYKPYVILWAVKVKYYKNEVEMKALRIDFTWLVEATTFIGVKCS